MKRLILKISLRLLILMVIWVALSRSIPRPWYMGPEYLRWQTVFQAIEGRQEKPLPRNLIFGDSGPEMGLDAKQLRAANLSLGGSSFPEGYHLLQLLQDHRIDTLYLSYGVFHFQSMDCFYTRSEFYDFIPDSYLDEVKALIAETQDSVYMDKGWEWLRVLDRTFPFEWMRRELRYIHNIYDVTQYNWYFSQGQAARDSMLANQYSYLVPPKGCPKDSMSLGKRLEDTEGQFRVTPVNAHYFRKMMEECQRRHIQVIWINMPLNAGTIPPSPHYQASFEHGLSMMLPSDVPVVPHRYLDPCQFRDFAHLNRDAARQYTTWLSGYLADSLHPAAATLAPDSLP